ncbi:MAG: alpha/beta fold hydrolase [Beijerinckiaceae bacterium]
MPKPDIVRFPSRNGHELAARYDAPAGRTRGTAIFAHCFTCSKDILAARRIADGLAQKGIGVLRFDFTGLGHSDGEFANAGFTSNVEDIVAAAAWMAENIAAPDLLVGHSLGGAAVLSAAGKLPGIKGLATIGAPADPAHVAHLLRDSRADIEKKGCATVSIAGREFEVCKTFLDDLDAQKQRQAIEQLHRDLLILHAPLDEIVGIDNAAQIFQAARHPKSFVSLDKADHLLTRPQDAGFAAVIIAAWSSRLLPPEAVSAPKEGHVIVEPTGNGLFPHVVTAGNHTILADEPESFGGANSGLSPYELLLAGLGACTSMTMRMYADRKGWPADHIRVDLTHAKKYVSDCEGCETEPAKMDVIERNITIGDALTGEQKQRLMEIADKCPVHRTLESDIRIVTALAKDTDPA